jgi:hypothetical protein
MAETVGRDFMLAGLFHHGQAAGIEPAIELLQ